MENLCKSRASIFATDYTDKHKLIVKSTFEKISVNPFYPCHPCAINTPVFS